VRNWATIEPPAKEAPDETLNLLYTCVLFKRISSCTAVTPPHHQCTERSKLASRLSATPPNTSGKVQPTQQANYHGTHVHNVGTPVQAILRIVATDAAAERHQHQHQHEQQHQHGLLDAAHEVEVAARRGRGQEVHGQRTVGCVWSAEGLVC
jgi:hypothetical protein